MVAGFHFIFKATFPIKRCYGNTNHSNLEIYMFFDCISCCTNTKVAAEIKTDTGLTLNTITFHFTDCLCQLKFHNEEKMLQFIQDYSSHN